VATTNFTSHQLAVSALLELGCCRAIPEGERAFPLAAIPSIFRAALSGDNTQYPQERAILEHALTLLEEANGDKRAPEMREFFAALLFRMENGAVRVRYDVEYAN